MINENTFALKTVFLIGLKIQQKAKTQQGFPPRIRLKTKNPTKFGERRHISAFSPKPKARQKKGFSDKILSGITAFFGQLQTKSNIKKSKVKKFGVQKSKEILRQSSENNRKKGGNKVKIWTF